MLLRVECAKCRRERDLSWTRATLCGDRACRAREMQARARFVPCCRDRACRAREMQARVRFVRYPRNPAQPSAEIVRVERAKCRRECELSGSGATLCGDRACRVREKQARVRLIPCARVSVKLEDENWRLANTTLVRGARWGAGS